MEFVVPVLYYAFVVIIITAFILLLSYRSSVFVLGHVDHNLGRHYHLLVVGFQEV